eukprot:Tbor_TRINITY_DN5677_c1_g1::TRINITY_DN5677_c1_g1_i1::g.9098::m.9098/K15371/GDH2; glutamate dehydrogenase
MYRGIIASGNSVLAQLRRVAPLNNQYRYASTITPAEVINEVNAREIFAPKKVDTLINQYFKLGFSPYYFINNSREAVTEHALGYLRAEAERECGSAFCNINIKDDSAFFFCSDTESSQLECLKRVDQFILSHKNRSHTHATSIRSYRSQHNEGHPCVLLFTCNINEFVNTNPQKAIDEAGVPSLDIVGSKELQGSSDIARARYNEILAEMHSSFTPVYKIYKSEANDDQVLTIAFKADRISYFIPLTSLIEEIPNAKINKRFMESFSNGVQNYTFHVSGATPDELEVKANLIGQLPNRPNNAITRLIETKEFTAEEAVFANCMLIYAFYFTPPADSEDYQRLRAMVEKEEIGITRLNSLRASLNQEIMSERHLGTVVAQNSDLFRKIFEDFKKGSTAESRKVLNDVVSAKFDTDKYTRAIFHSIVRFNSAVVKHNFFKAKKAALCFRLDPKAFIPLLDFPRVPHAIFMFVGPQWRGFHIRFTDIARGGVRMIISDPRNYKNNKTTVFQENYNLAFTQLLKNKDIPEGGSKGTLLVSTRTTGTLDAHHKLSMFRQYIDALQDVILPNQSGVVDNLKETEIIFLGPDENTAGTYPTIAALHAKERGYSWWRSFTTGKDQSLGGIPHDEFGMTTRSIRMCVEGIYNKLGLDQKNLTKFQTGGPDGDIGSNEIIFSKEKMRGIVDGSGVLYDPNGIDRNELMRLAKERKTIIHFDTSKLSKDGFFLAADKNRDAAGESTTLPDGTIVTKTIEFRDQFHLSEYASSDVFVTGGGRPRSVTLDNVHQLLRNHPLATGELMLRGMVTGVKPEDLKYKIIVEGANLFITHDARLALERVGVVLIKDATANKGGVTCSSLEVYTGLCLSHEQHSKLMCGSKDGKTTPDFYKRIVKEICEIIENNSRKEFELIWRISQENPKLAKTIITDRLSRKIFEMRSFIYLSSMYEDKKFVRYVLDQYTPKTIKEVVTIDEIIERVPDNYLKAIFSIWLACNYVYDCGIDSNEFDFYDFMRTHRSRA